MHLNEFGNQVLAFAVLKGLGAPPLVSSVEIDAASLAVKSDGAVVTGAKRAGNSIEFTRRDYALPLTFWDPLERSDASIEKIFVPINGFYLRYANLPAGARYTLRADALELSPHCGFTGEQLGRRLNLATLTSSYHQPRGPWAQQAIALARTTEAKAALEWAIFYQGKEGLATSAWQLFKARADSAIESAAKAQKTIAMARANRYVLTPLSGDSVARCAERR